MKIMIDTNVLVSAIYNPNSTPARAVQDVCKNHELVLCDHIVAECYDVIERRFSQHMPVMDTLLTTLGYELVVAPRTGLSMQDPKDSPILNAAILADVDVIISGDKHFLNLTLERPKTMTAAQYLESIQTEPE